MFFDRDLTEQPVEPVDLLLPKSTLLPTSFSPFPGQNDSNHDHDSSGEISLGRDISTENASALVTAIRAYLPHVGEPLWDEAKLAEEKRIERWGPSVPRTAKAMIEESSLGREEKDKLLEACSGCWQLGEWIVEMSSKLPEQLWREVLTITGKSLVGKWSDYQKMQNGQVLELLPKMERMWGWEGQEQSSNTVWNTCQEIDYEEVTKMNEQHIEQLSSELYSTSKLDTLAPEGANCSGFGELVTFISLSVFLTLSGMTIKAGEVKDFEQLLTASGADKPSKKTKFT